MNALPFDYRQRPVEAVRELVAEHGFRPVLIALIDLGLRPRGLPPAASGADRLSDHLRRDIGLPPLGPSADDPWLDGRGPGVRW